MKILLFFAALLISSVQAYEITGAKPIDKLAVEQAKAKTGKKLMCIVYKGSDNNCPHCAAAADNGVKAVRGSTETVFITEAQVKDKAIMDKLPKPVQDMLRKQPGNAWVSFTVFDQEMTSIIAASSRYSLETDRKATKEFTEKVRAAQKELK